MQLVGEGLQFRVFDAGNRRVRKCQKSIAEQVLMLIKWWKFPRGLLWIQSPRKTEHSVRTSIARVPADDAYMIGNATLCDGGYEQDYAPPLFWHFEQNSLEQNKAAIDGYIDNVLALARYGIARPVFNFAGDHGMYDNGCVCNLDLGDFVFTPEPMLKAIERKRWLRDYSYCKGVKDPELRAYFAHQMDVRLTPHAFKREWELYI